MVTACVVVVALVVDAELEALACVTATVDVCDVLSVLVSLPSVLARLESRQ